VLIDSADWTCQRATRIPPDLIRQRLRFVRCADSRLGSRAARGGASTAAQSGSSAGPEHEELRLKLALVETRSHAFHASSTTSPSIAARRRADSRSPPTTATSSASFRTGASRGRDVRESSGCRLVGSPLVVRRSLPISSATREGCAPVGVAKPLENVVNDEPRMCRNAVVALAGLAVAAPPVAAITAAIGAAAVLGDFAYRVLREVAGTTIGLYRTSWLQYRDKFGEGRHPQGDGSYRVDDFSFWYDIVTEEEADDQAAEAVERERATFRSATEIANWFASSAPSVSATIVRARPTCGSNRATSSSCCKRSARALGRDLLLCGDVVDAGASERHDHG
jgi:hypothetical protein